MTNTTMSESGYRGYVGADLLRPRCLLLNPKQILLHLPLWSQERPPLPRLRLLKLNAGGRSFWLERRGYKRGRPLPSLSLPPPPPARYRNRRCEDRIWWRGHHADCATCSALHPLRVCAVDLRAEDMIRLDRLTTG